MPFLLRGQRPGSGQSDVATCIAPSGLTIANVTFTFTISGSFSGGFYRYLSHHGALIPLLNRLGTGPGDSFGYGDAGFTGATLAVSGSVKIHSYGGGFVPNGSYLPDSGGVTFAQTFQGLRTGTGRYSWPTFPAQAGRTRW